MRLKLVVPKDKNEYENSVLPYYYISDDKPQIKLIITYEEYLWLYDNHVWDEISEITGSLWIDYGEEDYIDDIESIKKIKDYLILFMTSVVRDKEKENLLNNIINLCNEAIQRETGICFIL